VEALLDYCASAMSRLESEEFRAVPRPQNVLIADEVLQKGNADQHAGVRAKWSSMRLS
jgi:DNA repair protein RadC